MTTETSPQLITVDPREVTFIIHRDRETKAFKKVKESIRVMGIRIPLRVRNIEDWPKEKRTRPDGGVYKWQAFFGEGRCIIAIELYEETKDRSWLEVPALRDEKSSESEIAVAFLTENISRSSLSWQEQAQLIRAELGDRKPDRKTVKALRKAFFVTEAHILKLLRILNKLSPDLEKELKGLTVQDAEALTALPAKGQNIVFETLHEEGLAKSDVAAVVKRAKRLTEEGAPLSKKALRDELRRIREDLERERKTAKPLRLHWSLGPANLQTLLADKQWRKALDKEGVNYAKFEEQTR